MLIVLTIHFMVALGAPFLFRWFGRSAFYVLAAVPGFSFLWLLTRHDAVYGSGQPPAATLRWVPELHLELDFRMDALSWVLSLLVLGVGSLVLFYCARYFTPRDRNMAGFGGQLLAFAGVMFALVTADDLILLFIFWELTTLLSYLLIGYSRTRLAARRAALQALVVTTFGGLVMLVGLVLIGQTQGTYRISELVTAAAHGAGAGPVTDVAVALVLVGVMTKSALVPFHFWLPGAMAAPTPVSAYLHAAAMVKAGIYLVARLAPGYASAPSWEPVLLTLGLATMLVGGWRALRQTDIKLILAYGTVSQLGFLAMVVGLGTRDAALAGLAMLLAHGLFKAALFLVVGIIDHQAGTRDLRELSGLRSAAPKLTAVAAVAAASMAGVPPLAGFVAKEAVLGVFVERAREVPGLLLLAGVVLGSMLTFAYSARFLWGAFAVKPGVPATAFKPVSWPFLAAPALLAAGSVLYGLWPAPAEGWIAPYAHLFAADGESAHLVLWHGLTPALGLTALSIGAGAALFRWRAGVARVQGLLPPAVDAERAYRGLIGLLDDTAVWLTGRTQRGSLFVYLTVILSAAIVAPVAALLLAGNPWPRAVYLVDPSSPLQLVAGAGIVLGALAATRANKRFLAVLMVSVTGYGIALIFALQGAPDLALTQMLVETVILVAFVLALRRLPARLWKRWPARHRLGRALIGVAFGAAMIFVAVFALGARTAEPVSLRFPELAYKGGGGLNIVNVTLVDIRAWDTFGEISVLAVAATGVASLIFVRHRGDQLRRASSVQAGSVGRVLQREPSRRDAAALATARRFATAPRDAWLLAGHTLAPERRSIIFEVITRLVFHTVIVFSLYLLLAGHNSPGGGFAGGLMAGMALAIRYLAGGRFELAEATRLSPGTLLGLGLGTASLAGIVPLLLGGEVFQSAILELSLPVFGDIKFVTSTVFDIGVYLIVVGLVLDVLRSQGAEIDEQIDAAEERNAALEQLADRIPAGRREAR